MSLAEDFALFKFKRISRNHGEYQVEVLSGLTDKEDVPPAVQFKKGNKSTFDVLFEDAFSGLQEYHPNQLTKDSKERLKSAVKGGFKDTGNAQDDYQKVRNAIEKVLAVQEMQANIRYNQICNSQGWNEDSQIIHLEGFLRDKGLFAEFVAYAEKAAEEENTMSEDSEDSPRMQSRDRLE